MKLRILMAFCVVLMASGVVAAELTRSVELSAENSGAVFAVPNGFSFTRAYATDAEGGSVPVSVGAPTTMNHVTLIPVTTLSTSLHHLTVVFTDDGELFTGRPAKVMREAIKEKVANPEDVPTTKYVAPSRSRLKLAAPLSLDDEPAAQTIAGADVLILSPHDNVALWNKYATFRKSTAVGADLTFKVVDLNDVYEAYPWTGDSPTAGVRNAAESIHKYLRENRDNLGISYVILGGSWIDAQFINANGDWERNGNVVKTLDGNNMSLTNAVPGIIAHPRRETEEIPSDMFYACLDLKNGQTYPWTKGDATHYYESFNNESDRAEYDSGVDVVVSRIAFKPLEFTIPEGARILPKYAETMRVGESHLFTPAELMDYWCEKIRRAEAEDYAGMGRMGFSWGDFNYMKRPSDGSLPEEYEFYDDIPNLFATDRQTDRYGNLEIRERQRIKTLVAPNYPLRAVDARCDHGTTWTKGLESVAAAQEQFLATDHDFNVVAMHGWAGGSAWYHVEDTYKQTGLILFNDMSLPCETGWPDFVNGTTYISQPCCGEATVAVPFGGSIASVNNTRSGFEGGAQSLSDRHNFNSHKGFLQEGLNAGTTWLNAHLDFAGISAETAQDGFAPSNNGGTGAWVLSEHILYGDPLVRSQAFKVYDSPLSLFPQVAKSAVLASEVTVSQEGAVVTATTAGDITITGSGTGRMKITKVLEVGGTSVTINGDLEGGIALIKFMGEPGTVTINSTGRFYLGGVENCAAINVTGSGAIIDCDHISGVTEINFTVDDSASNILRGKTVGALAGVAINSIGGSLVFESHDLLGNTTVQLEGTTVKLGSDPTVGSLVASGEPLRATFTGSGIIEYQHGTELLRDWTIAGQIKLKEIGDLAIGFDYTGALGSNPTGWFSSWGGENFDDTEAYLAPRGFVHVVKDKKHPHASLAAKTGFTMALYANLVKVENSNAVLLSYGTVNSSDSQILLVKNGAKIQLVETGSYGGTALASVEADYPGAGYHLYMIERKGNELSLKIDCGEKKTINRAFTLSSGLQIGSQFGGLNGRSKAIGMAVAGLRGYDAILNDKEMSALIAEFPAMPPPITVDADIELNVEGVEARLINATITDGHYLGGSNGDLYIPDTVTVNVQGMKLNNTSRSADAVTNDVYGVLNVTGTTTRGPYEDLQNASTMAGIMLGHWAGTSTLNIHTGGLVNAPNGELLMGYTATGNLNINGGKLVVRSITNYSRFLGVRKDGCPITITNGGTLEIADWPCQNQTAPGTMPITINDGAIKATADWTCPWPLTVSGPLTIDANGHKLVFLGAISGPGKITVIDSSEAKIGSVLFSGDLTNYTNTIRVSSEVTAIGVRAGQEAKLDFAGAPAKLMVALSSSQLNADYDATAFASRVTDGATVEFTDYSGYDYQSIPGTTRYTQWSPMPYVYDDITWGNVYLPYERGIWEPLINWREFKTQTVNGETYTKAIQKYVSGAAPQATSNCGRWDPIILNGDEFEGEKGEDGFYDVHVDYLEGWLIRLGLYNGVHLYVENLNKVQRGGASNPTPYIRVGANSRLTIAKCGTGNTDVTIPLYVASSDGIVFKTNVFDKNFEYYLTEGGSVKFESGVSAGAHKVKEVHATAGDATGAYYNLKGVKVADFNNKGSTARFTSEDGALKLAGYDGTTRYLANSLAVLSDAKSSGLGGFTLMQGDAGVYAMYAEKSVTPPTEITINGNQTDLNLVNLPYDTITKIKIAGAWGYFKGEDHTISTQVEFNDTAAGLPAFRWENGYGSKYVAFENATGHGTIFINGGTRTSQAMFFKGGDFDGSIILTNGNNRVFFGTPTAVQQAWASRIEVKSGATANLKDGGIWAASELAIDGTLVCKGRADVICFGGITGVDHIEIPDGYEKSVMKIGGNVARVWVLPQGEVPQAEGQLNFQFGAVTIPSFDMGDHLLKVTSGTVTLEEDAVVIAPRLEVAGGASFVAAAKVGDTYYGSFANAVAAANNGAKTITLLQNVANFNLPVGDRLSLIKNDCEISFADGLVVEETANDDGSVSYLSTSTRYDIAYHVADVDGNAWDVSTLKPTYFTVEQLPVTLPMPTASDKVFHGWYREADYSDTAIDRINDDMLPRMEFALYGYWLPAVATVNGVAYDNWEDAIAAHDRTGRSIVVLVRGNEPTGYFTNEDGYLVQIQATVQVGETTTRFSSFAAARTFAKGKEGAVITLITNSPTDLILDNGETVLVNLNDHTLDVVAADPENYNVNWSFDETSGVTTYWTSHRDVVITLPELPDGVTATVAANGVTIAANTNGDYVVPYNAEVTITYAVTGAFTLDKTSEETFAANGDKTAESFTAPVKAAAVAKRGNTYYPSVQSALSAATSGETVTVVSTPAAEAITIPAGVTLDIGSHGWNDFSCVPSGGYEIIAEEGAVLRGVVYNAHYPTIKSLTLKGDCSFGTEESSLAGVFGLGTGENGASSITLNGHTLHVWGSDNVNFFFETTTVTDAGTINVHKGRFMSHCNALQASQAKLIFSGNSTPVLEAGATVGELEITTTGTLTVSNNKALTIANQNTKKYLTAAEMHKITLGTGATFDYGWQPGKVISINFNAGSSTDAKWMSGETVDMTFAGKVPRNSWVNTTGGNGTNVAVGQCWDSDANNGVGAVQAISGMTLGYSSNGTYYPGSATLPFMKGYLDIANYAGGVDRVTLNLAGIPFKKYDVIVYFQGDGNHGFRPVQVTHNFGATTEVYGYNSAFEVVKERYTDPWGQSNQAEISYEKNALRINGLVGSVLKVEPLPRSTVRASVAAIQIVENTEGVITYRRNPEATSNDWMVEDGWLLPDGTPVTWRNPDLASGQIYTAEIDADHISDIKLTSQVSASSVIVTSTTEKEFKFLTDEDLGHVATPDDNPKSILNAPVDATGFKGALYLQSRISGAFSMGTQMHITFVAMDEGVETTAYPYEFVGNLSTITKIGPGIFRVPQSMAGVPYNIEAGYILYDYEGDDTVQLGKVTGEGTAILKTANLQLAADNTANLDWQSDYLKVTGNLFASGSTKTLNIPTDKTVEVIDNSDQTGARDNVYTGSGTIVFGGNGSGYHLLNANNLPANSLTMQLENSKGVIIPNNGITLSNVSGSKGFRTDHGQTTTRSVNFIQSKNTIWNGNFVCGNNPDRIGTVTVSGAQDATEKTLTLAGDYSDVDNALVIESSGSVKLTGTWKGNVTVNGEFGGTGTIKNSTVTFAAGSTLNAAWGPIVIGEGASFAEGSMTVVDASVGATIFTLGDGVEVATLPTLTNEGYALKQDGSAIKFVIAEGYAPVYAADGTTIESVRGVGKIYVSSTASSQAWGNEVTFETSEGKRTTFIKGNTPETTDTVVVLKTTQFWVKDDKSGTTLEIGDEDHEVTVAFAQSGENASYTVNGLHLKIAAGSQVDIDNVSRASDSSWSKNATPEVHDATIEGEGTVCIPSTMSATFSGTTTVSTAIKLEGSLIVNNTASINESKLYTIGTRKYIKKTVNAGSVSYTIATVPEATRSLGFDNNANASTILGGTATHNQSGAATKVTYELIRGTTDNYGGTIASIWSDQCILGQNNENATSWSILTVAKLTDANNHVLWSTGKSQANPKTGLALAQSGGKTIKLVNWKNGAADVEILSYSVTDTSLLAQFHNYLVTFDGTTFKLYVDGVEADSESTSDSLSYSMTAYQFCGVHGNGYNSYGTGCGMLIDEFGAWSGTALSADEAKGLSGFYPVWPTVVDDDTDIPFGTKVIGLSTDTCSWKSTAVGQFISSRVGQTYNQVLVTVLVNLTGESSHIMSIGEGTTGGTAAHTADLFWSGTQLYLGYDGGNARSKKIDASTGLHVLSLKVVGGEGVYLYVDGASDASITDTGIKWTNPQHKPTGTFTYQGDIKSITLDFSSSNAVSGLETLPSITENGVAVKKTVANLEKIEEIMTMTGKRIDEGDISLEVSLGSFVETGAADTIGITVGTSLDLPNGEVTILVEDGAGSFSPLESSPTLTSPTKNDSRTIVLPISSLLDGAKSRLFKIRARTKGRSL